MAASDYINNLGVGATLVINDIADAIHNSDTRILDVGSPNKPLEQIFIWRSRDDGSRYSRYLVNNYQPALGERVNVVPLSPMPALPPPESTAAPGARGGAQKQPICGLEGDGEGWLVGGWGRVSKCEMKCVMVVVPPWVGGGSPSAGQKRVLYFPFCSRKACFGPGETAIAGRCGGRGSGCRPVEG